MSRWKTWEISRADLRFCHGARDFLVSGSEVVKIGVDMVIEGYMTFMGLKHHIIVTSIATICNK